MKIEEVIKKLKGDDSLDLYDNSEHIEIWKSWYAGNVKNFHEYTVYNGRGYVKQQRMSLQMAKKVCEDWANLLMNEKTDVTIGDQHTQETIEKVFEDTKFWKRANKNIEQTFALGIGAWVIGIKNITVDEEGATLQDGDIEFSFLCGDKVRPITIENDEIIECAFVNIKTGGATLVAHIIGDDGNYHILSVEGTGKDGNYNFDFENILDFNTGSKLKWFYILTPNIANNIDVNSPLGTSIFANSIDTLKKIDLVFDSEATEFMLGKKRVFINASQYYVNTKNGEEVATFDSNDILFYVLPESMDGSQILQDNTQALRIAEHQMGLQEQLNILSYQCGMGTEHYKFDKGSVATATQIISENSDMFRNIKKHEIVIEDALISIVKALIYAINNFTAETAQEGVNIEVKFDDSIIQDKNTEKEQDRLDVQLGAMSLVEYRSKWYNEDEETAEAKIMDMSKYSIEEPELEEEPTEDTENTDNTEGEQ